MQSYFEHGFALLKEKKETFEPIDPISVRFECLLVCTRNRICSSRDTDADANFSFNPPRATASSRPEVNFISRAQQLRLLWSLILDEKSFYCCRAEEENCIRQAFSTLTVRLTIYCFSFIKPHTTSALHAKREHSSSSRSGESLSWF